MPLFLTGARQVGKSTALRKALAPSEKRFGGVMTRFDARHGGRKLYLLPYSLSEALPESIPDCAVCARMGAEGRRANPAVFDTLGVELLRKAMADADVDGLRFQSGSSRRGAQDAGRGDPARADARRKGGGRRNAGG